MSIKTGVEALSISDLRWRYPDGNVRMSQAKVSEHVYRGLLKYAPEDWELEVISRKPWRVLPDETADFARRKGKNLVLSQPPLLPFGNRWSILPIRNFLMKHRYPERVRREGLHLMNFTDSFPWGEQSLAKAEVLTALDFYQNRDDPAQWDRIKKRVRRRAENLWVAAISNFTAGEAAHYLEIPADRIRTLYLAVDHSIYQASPEAEDEEESSNHSFGRYVLYVGARYGRKNLTTLLTAIEQYNESAAEPLSLVLAGASGYASAAEKSALGIQMAELRRTAVHEVGILSDEQMAVLYRQAMFLVHPATFEGFGFTVMEAMACGLPVICGRASSLAEVGGDAAYFLADVKDVEAMTHAIRVIAEDSEQRQKMRAAGLLHARTFTWDRFEKGIAELNRTALASH